MADPTKLPAPVQTHQLPFEHKAEAWTVDEAVAFTLDTQGYACDKAEVGVCRFEPSAGVFTTYDIVPQIWREESGWQVVTADIHTEASNNAVEIRLDIRDAQRFGFRVDNTAGGTGGNKYVALA